MLNTLVLNANYVPLSVINEQRAVVLDINHPNMTVLSYYDKKIIGLSESYDIPAVMVLNKYIKMHHKKHYPTKRNIRLRDKGTCGYCGINLDSKNFTIDHIIPISHFKKRQEANTWENQISCCKSCNSKKGNRTPEQAGMELKQNPKQPKNIIFYNKPPQEWQPYL